MKNEAIEMFLSRELQEIVVVLVAGGGRGGSTHRIPVVSTEGSS